MLLISKFSSSHRSFSHISWDFFFQLCCTDDSIGTGMSQATLEEMSSAAAKTDAVSSSEDDVIELEATSLRKVKMLPLQAPSLRSKKKFPERRFGTPKQVQSSSREGKQSSVLDFFRPSFGRAKDKPCSKLLSPPVPSVRTDSSCDTSSSQAGGRRSSVGPWPFKQQATSKAGK